MASNGFRPIEVNGRWPTQARASPLIIYEVAMMVLIGDLISLPDLVWWPTMNTVFLYLVFVCFCLFFVLSKSASLPSEKKTTGRKLERLAFVPSSGFVRVNSVH